MAMGTITVRARPCLALTASLACLPVLTGACGNGGRTGGSSHDDIAASSTGGVSNTGDVSNPGDTASSSGSASGTGRSSSGASSSQGVASESSSRSSATEPEGGTSPADAGPVETVGVDGGSGTCAGGAAQSTDVTIDMSRRQQRITGFGNSSAWGGTLNNATSDPDILWSTATGAGLSMLRIRYGDGLGLAKAAAQRGVTVWMTPWGTGSGGSPGGPDTTSQSNPNGCKGTMPVLSNGQDLANNLVTWIQSAKSQGVPIYAVSAENEPDSCGINQTTSYSPAQLTAWIATYLGPAMASIGVKVIAPETQNGCGFPGYFSSIQGNPAAWSAVSIFASHEYGCGSLPVEPSIAPAGKEYWETEVDTGAVNGDSDGMPSALNLAQTIHADLTQANLNAWHYWWMYAGGTSGLYDTTTKVWRKALWVMGNFSRFVRPGYFRVSTSGNPPSGVALSAYVNPSSGALVVVAINKNTSSTSVPLYVSGSAPCMLDSWETSANNDLVQGSPVSVSNSRASLTLTGQSVTTFVGMP